MPDENIEYLISKLQSTYADQRYEACEGLRKATEITPEAVKALEIALHDPDEDVRGAARRTLNSRTLTYPWTQEPYQSNPSIKKQDQFSLGETSPAQVLARSQMPGVSPNTPEYIFNLEKRILVLELELQRALKELQALSSDVREVRNEIPDSNLLSHDYLKRAFAVWGHAFVASLIISIPLYILYFLFLSWLIRNQ